MFDTPPSQFGKDLAERLAQKTGFSVEQARTFLHALTELLTQSERTPHASSTEQEFCFPLVENEEGKMVADTSNISAWFPISPIPIPRTHKPSIQPPVPAQPNPPAAPPGKPRKRPPGGYPGPSVYIVIDNPEETHLELNKIDLSNLGEALANAKQTSSLEDMLQHYAAGNFGKLEEL